MAVALVVATVVLALPGDRRDETPVEPAGTVQLSYRVDPAAAEQSARILRARLNAAGIRPAAVSVTAGGLTVAVGPAARADIAALLQSGRLAIYDWDRNVLGPDGTTAPTDPEVTGGADAGRAAAITKAEAQARAEGHPGARVVQAEDAGDEADRWFALAGPPALTNADVAHASAVEDPATQEPIVAIDLTPQGQDAFTALTRTVAQRGADNAGPGAADMAGNHHIAIVIDDRIVAVPYIDFRTAPDGIDGADGTHIPGLTPDTARQLAAILSAGPLPAP